MLARHCRRRFFTLPVPWRYFVPPLPSLARSGHPYRVRVSDSVTVWTVQQSPHKIEVNWHRPPSNHHNFSTTCPNCTLKLRIRSRKLLDQFFLTEVLIPELAARFNIPARHLENRLKGTLSRNAQVLASRKLSPAEEVAVCRYIDRLDQLGLCVRPPILRNCANVILARNHDSNSPPPTVSSR